MGFVTIGTVEPQILSTATTVPEFDTGFQLTKWII